MAREYFFPCLRAFRALLFPASLLPALALLVLLLPAGAQAADLPKIAVTDLTYEEQVSSYFSYSEDRVRSRSSSSDTDYSSRSRDSYDRSRIEASGEVIRIERGELHKFTGDIKGALIKSGNYRLTQGKPWSEGSKIKLFDVIERIRKGMYPGADYVLFGTISSIESRMEALPLQGTASVNNILSVELVVDFSLINTKTYEVVAAFTAMGEGSDMRLTSMAGTSIALSSSKAIREASYSLGEEVAAEMSAQFSPEAGSFVGRPRQQMAPPMDGPVTIYR